MRLYQKLSFAFLSYLIGVSLFAQGGQNINSDLRGSLSGSLQDENEISIPFATVAVYKLPDSTVVTGSTSDIEGNFSIKTPAPGNYYLQFSSIGYTSVNSDSFEISSKAFARDFGTMVMPEQSTMLNEVMVKAWKPQVRTENGKMVMNVEGTAIAAGNTAYEMLSRAPGVSVDQSGGFMINGQKGVSVMLNGRLTFLTPDELKTLLESMPAENIKEIEVVHTPSSKYDAEGVSGILNIKFKENTMSGFNGSIYGGLFYNRKSLFNGGLNLNHKKGRWNTFLNFDLSERGFYRDRQTLRTFPGDENASEFRSKGFQGVDNLIPSIQVGTDFEINEKHSLGFISNLIYKNSESDWNTSSTVGLPSDPFVNIDAKNRQEKDFRNERFNLHYIGELDTLGTSISADLDFARLETDSRSDFTNQFNYVEDEAEDLEKLYNKKDLGFDIYSARLDLNLPISESSNIETGLKASKVISDSDLEFFEFEEEAFQLDAGRSERFRYKENIYAAYASYSNLINDTWNIQLGLRAEQTVGKSKLFSTGNITERDYLNFFPNIMIEQNVSENYKLNYSFNRRIKRPAYQALNPSIFYMDPYSYIIGNPDLLPQISNSFKLSQTIFKKFNLLLGYDYSKDYLGESLSTDPETGETIYTTQNLNYLRNYNATVVAPVELASFWNVNNTLVVTYQDYNLEIDGQSLENKNLFSMLQSNHQLSLPGDLSLEVNGTVQGPVASGIYNVDGLWWIDAGLKKSFFDGKLNASLRMTDVFKSRNFHIEAEYVGNTFTLDQYLYDQALSINLRYNFNDGNKAKKRSRSNDLEELNRAGG